MIDYHRANIIMQKKIKQYFDFMFVICNFVWLKMYS